MTENFTWRDGDRTIRFGAGALADAPALLDADYVLLTGASGPRLAPELAAGATRTVVVGPGRVDELAGDLLPRLQGAGQLVALGGGRVIDTAKALALALGGSATVAAIPTTLSGAEMSRGHRPARGTTMTTPFRRPALVINDPRLCASQPPPGLAGSAANALAHAVEGAVTTVATPVPTLAARDAARRLAAALPADGEPDRDELALGALLAGYAIDANSFGVHHVMSQTLVREAGIGHGEANAALLQVTSAALRRGAPDAVAALDAAIGEPVEAVARRFAALAGAVRLRDLGVPEGLLATCAEGAAPRAELALTPPALGPRELEKLYREAW